MYFRGKLSIDPSQLTKIQKVEPETGFKKLLYKVTGGFAETRHIETFKAVNILQQLYSSLQSRGIDDVIRLTHDDIDIYHDSKSAKHDLNFALDKYQIEIDESMSTHFKSIWLVLEHEDDNYKYLLEISIKKRHKENEYPIELVISGLLKEFEPKPGESKEELKTRMQAHFRNQETYNTFVTTKKLAFEQFLESLRFETMKHIRVDDIKMDIKTRMVMQKEKREPQQKTVEPEYGGMPYGYFGFGDLLLYSWLWSELVYDHHIHIDNVEMMAEDGDLISSIGEEGIDAGESAAFDYNEDFDTRMEDFDTSVTDDFGGEDFAGMESFGEDESTRSWFDGVFDDVDFGDFDF